MKDILELYEGYLSYTDKRNKLLEEIKLLKLKHQQELKVLLDKLDKLEKDDNKNELKKRLHNEGYSYGSFILSSRLLEGQKISTFNYFKSLLEKKVNKELILVKFITPFSKTFKEIEDYYGYDVDKTLIDEMLIPKEKIVEYFKIFKKMNQNNYEKVIKKLPDVFLLKREWVEGKYKAGIEEIDNNVWYIISTYCLDGERKFGLFSNDEYNKDIEFDKIVLKTFEYYLKSKEFENVLKQKSDLEKRLNQQNQLQQELIKKSKKAQKLSNELNNYHNK